MLLRKTLGPVAVIGREGSTEEGEGFIPRLWQEANAHFDDIAPLVVRTASGVLPGIWGAMSDMSRSFRPWENGFTRGLYLAGAAVALDAEAPAGWTKWVLPASEYACVVNDAPEAFAHGLDALAAEGLTLCGAAYDYTDLETGTMYIYYPIRRL